MVSGRSGVGEVMVFGRRGVRPWQGAGEMGWLGLGGCDGKWG